MKKKKGKKHLVGKTTRWLVLKRKVVEQSQIAYQRKEVKDNG